MNTNVTRRHFLGTAAGTAGIAAIGPMAAAGAEAISEKAAAILKEERDLYVGMLTAPFGNDSLETVANFAKDAGIHGLEVVADPGGKQIDPQTLDQAGADAVKALVADRGLEITSLAWYEDLVEPEKAEERQAHAIKIIDAASMLGVGVVCLSPGYPAPRMTKINTIKKVLPKVFAPLIAHASEKGVKIALENYFQTNLQGIDTFECLFETIQDPNFGLNYDPSHLYHQQCDHLLPVSMFAKRIFHTHAKDCLVDKAARARMGVYAEGWWRYAIPGFGDINWGEYTSHLRSNGYKGVMSIEHEDSAFGRERGFILGARYLEQFC
jgi:sugar phosphate isomerase/epimerase